MFLKIKFSFNKATLGTTIMGILTNTSANVFADLLQYRNLIFLTALVNS